MTLPLLRPAPDAKSKGLEDFPPAVAAGSTTAGVVGSVASPSAAGRVPAFSYAISVASCGGGSADDPPSRLEHPLYFSVGDGDLGPYAGAAVTSGVLASAPEIAERMVAAAWIADRRWDITLDNEVVVRLPEDDPAGALTRLMRVNNDHDLLTQDIVSIDLRVDDRLVVETPSAEVAEAINPPDRALS